MRGRLEPGTHITFEALAFYNVGCVQPEDFLNLCWAFSFTDRYRSAIEIHDPNLFEKIWSRCAGSMVWDQKCGYAKHK